MASRSSEIIASLPATATLNDQRDALCAEFDIETWKKQTRTAPLIPWQYRSESSESSACRRRAFEDLLAKDRMEAFAQRLEFYSAHELLKGDVASWLDCLPDSHTIYALLDDPSRPYVFTVGNTLLYDLPELVLYLPPRPTDAGMMADILRDRQGTVAATLLNGKVKKMRPLFDSFSVLGQRAPPPPDWARCASAEELEDLGMMRWFHRNFLDSEIDGGRVWVVPITAAMSDIDSYAHMDCPDTARAGRWTVPPPAVLHASVLGNGTFVKNASSETFSVYLDRDLPLTGEASMTVVPRQLAKEGPRERIFECRICLGVVRRDLCLGDMLTSDQGTIFLGLSKEKQPFIFVSSITGLGMKFRTPELNACRKGSAITVRWVGAGRQLTFEVDGKQVIKPTSLPPGDYVFYAVLGSKAGVRLTGTEGLWATKVVTLSAELVAGKSAEISCHSAGGDVFETVAVDDVSEPFNALEQRVLSAITTKDAAPMLVLRDGTLLGEQHSYSTVNSIFGLGVAAPSIFDAPKVSGGGVALGSIFGAPSTAASAPCGLFGSSLPATSGFGTGCPFMSSSLFAPPATAQGGSGTGPANSRSIFGPGFSGFAASHSGSGGAGTGLPVVFSSLFAPPATAQGGSGSGLFAATEPANSGSIFGPGFFGFAASDSGSGGAGAGQPAVFSSLFAPPATAQGSSGS
eukprot:TRINITY_DN13445_c0_g1_i1.p1 TRINITY_DN13445_c0_g1~~TRINITY_DN13445_c0_g1_i1.p1  ORF type:complete len:688 (-),score=91.04 TRINITY_DN13445_c0_g1_i1:236-2299(-)